MKYYRIISLLIMATLGTLGMKADNGVICKAFDQTLLTHLLTPTDRKSVV